MSYDNNKQRARVMRAAKVSGQNTLERCPANSPLAH